MKLVDNGEKVCWLGNAQSLAQWNGQNSIWLQRIDGYLPRMRTGNEKSEVAYAHHIEDFSYTMDMIFVVWSWSYFQWGANIWGCQRGGGLIHERDFE